VNISIACKGGGDWGGLLSLLAVMKHMFTLVTVIPFKIENGNLEKISDHKLMNSGGSCGKGCQLPYRLIALADGVIVAWR